MMFSQMSLQELINKKVEKKPNGCWIWKGANTSGYGVIAIGKGKKRTVAHRFIYEKLVGKITIGKQLDHICRNRSCVNPKHLRQLTHKENILCGEGLSAKNLRKTHCNNGHKLSGKNLRIIKGKYGYQRKCKTCHAKWTLLKGRQKQRILNLAHKFAEDFFMIKDGWKGELDKNFY